jgi:V8-like Glu-specific endopeptidase
MLALLAGTALAQEAAPPGHINGTEAGTTGNYWTPQRMMKARPRPMPQRNSSAVTPNAGMPRVAPQTGQSQEGQPGSPPTIADSEAADFSVRIHPALSAAAVDDMAPEDSEPQSPDANSKFGFPFTTSEVQPVGEQVAYPQRAAGQLFFTEQGAGDFVCSGSTIRPGIVIVAGHCVAAPKAGNTPPHYFTNFLFVPATNNGSAPYGKWAPSWVDTTGEWWNGNDTVPNAQDVGMFAMNEQGGRRIGDVIGWYGWRTNALAGQHITMLGYPCNLDNCSVMIRTDAGNSVNGGNNTYEYGSAASGGASGGPWLIDFGTAPKNTGPDNWTLGTETVVAVTSYGPAGTSGYLGASQFNSSMVAVLNSLCGVVKSACN